MATREITVNGNTYNDGAYDPVTNPKGLANGGHRQNNNLINMLLDVLVDASAPLQDTSETSLAIGTGVKTAVLADNRPIPAGVAVYLISAADENNSMYGRVTEHTGANLEVNVTDTTGAGTHADWIIQPAGLKGATGDTGADYTANATLNALANAGTSGFAALFKFTNKAISYAMAAGDVIRATAVTNQTLPAGMTAGQMVVVARDTTAGSVTVPRNGQTINGVAQDFVMDQNKDIIMFICTAAGAVETRFIGSL